MLAPCANPAVLGSPGQLPVYQCQFAPVPSVPLTDSVLDCPMQIVVGFAEALLMDEVVLTVMVMLAQVVLLQVPIALTK